VQFIKKAAAILLMVMLSKIMAISANSPAIMTDVSSAQNVSLDFGFEHIGYAVYYEDENYFHFEDIGSAVYYVPERIPLGEFVLTAYCPCVQCCEIWSAEHPRNRNNPNFVQRTAGGNIAEAGRTVAATVNLPFGTELYIEGHGVYIVEDRGVPRRDLIDIFFDTHEEALAFGRQTAEVWMANSEVSN
jgi:3D (Asp-Asp-Asp) domain-containing protein